MARLLLLAAGLSGCLGTWNTRDKVLEAGVVAVTMADWSQTRYVTAQCAEINPIIGECGHRFNQNAYFISALVIQAVVAGLIGQDYRPVFLGSWLGAEGSTVWSNYADGVPFP